MRDAAALLLPFVLLVCASCSSEAPSGAEREGPSSDAPAAAREPRAPAFDFSPGGPISDAALGDYHVAMSCAVGGEDVGTMTFELWAQAAPVTTRNFLRLCDEGFYDGLGFHRVVRDFMVQGGDPNGDGTGDSPHGTIAAEFSDDPARAHGYGVISMARTQAPDSASAQFFVCTDDGPPVWSLDGSYASFGRLTSGVDTLEALADVPVTAAGRREVSTPTQPIVITRARVVPGPAPRAEGPIERPAPELGGEPATVVVQHVLVSFDEVPQLGATRTRDEARELAQELLERARAGGDLSAMVREHSSDPSQEGEELPGRYVLHNRGVRDAAAERALFELDKASRAEIVELEAKLRSGAMTREEAMRSELVQRLQAAQAAAGFARDQMAPAFGDVAFALAPGEVGLAEYDPQASPFGWHVIKRLE